MTHTKTPWHICEVTGMGLRLIRDANGYCVAEAVKPANSGAAYIDAAANAYLIAAAPDLLAACENMVAQLGGGNDFEAWEAAKAGLTAAISKARGQ